MQTCPISPLGLDVEYLRERVRETYDRVAREPQGDFHFHRGLDYAVEYLRYDREALAALPPLATSRFAGVGNPLRLAEIRPGSTVLDHACGAGMDLLLAAKLVGPTGRAIGVDATPAMRECAIKAAEQAGLDNVTVHEGYFERLPVEDASVDYVISNGVINLAPDKTKVFREIVRVLRPGGRLLMADVIVGRDLSPAVRTNADLWAACVGGAMTRIDVLRYAALVGLVGGTFGECFDCFKNTVVPQRFRNKLDVYGANFTAVKPRGSSIGLFL
jgi:arsenite methyltransferase